MRKLQLPREDARSSIADGRALGQIVRPLDIDGRLHSRRPLSAAVHAADDRDSRAGGGRQDHLRCLAQTGQRSSGHGGIAGRRERLSEWAARRPSRRWPSAPRTVPKVDRIVGPGNIYVAAAKKLLAGEVGIDFVAGPTEILIIAAEGDPRCIAADMLAQAEHDVDASAILLTTSQAPGRGGRGGDRAPAGKRCRPPPSPARRSQEQRHRACAQSLDEAVEISNRFAPEHLSIHDEALLPKIQHAGSVFVGPYSPEAAGDYASGPNHVLPTSGAARLRGGLSVGGFREGDLGAGTDAHGAARSLRRPSRRWRAPKAWKRTPARWRCGSHS